MCRTLATISPIKTAGAALDRPFSGVPVSASTPTDPPVSATTTTMIAKVIDSEPTATKISAARIPICRPA